MSVSGPGGGSASSAASSQASLEPVSGGRHAAIHGRSFRILFVCSANVCRSVLAEHLARQALGIRLGSHQAGFRVASAGISAQDGLPLHPYTAAVLRQFGAGGTDFSSRRIDQADVDEADLILSATLEHRDGVVALRPRASRRTYLLKEFARLVAPAAQECAYSDPADRPWRLVEHAARLRGQVPPSGPDDDEIADPSATQEAFLSCAYDILEVIGGILDALCGTDQPRSVVLSGQPDPLPQQSNRNSFRGGRSWLRRRHSSITRQ
jgi:protein-tyrosine phosphatase